MAAFREAMNRAPPTGDGTENVQARLKVYTDICHNIVPDSIFTRYMHRTLPAPDQLWAFKKEFAAQLALAGFMSHVMKIGDRTPIRIVFYKQSGECLVLARIRPMCTAVLMFLVCGCVRVPVQAAC